MELLNFALASGLPARAAAGPTGHRGPRAVQGPNRLCEGPHAHVERLEDGTEVKLGVFLSSTKTRRATTARNVLRS
ncbi:hypothetical protein GCM10010244_85950 [Streptomyces coeruleorubidus]|nr:hypothetical protein GCM10010244_85950 [Streptomyces bellus]